MNTRRRTQGFLIEALEREHFKEGTMNLKCPRCKTQELVSMPAGKDLLYKCPACHGLWFQGEDLRDVEELPESELMNLFQDQLEDAQVNSGSEKSAGL